MESVSLLRLTCAVAGLLLLTAGTVRADRFDDDLLERINRYRSEKGLGGLTMQPGLARLAREHSRDMMQRRRMDHDRFKTRFRAAAAEGARSCVENVAWNLPTPAELFEGWRNSPGHDRNMLDPAVNRAGIARVGRYVTFFACEIPVQTIP